MSELTRTCGTCESSVDVPELNKNVYDRLSEVMCAKHLMPNGEYIPLAGVILEVDDNADKCPEWEQKDNQEQ